ADLAELRRRALVAAAADGERRGAGQRVDFAVEAARLLDVADPKRQAEVRRRLEFDAGIHAGDRQRAGFGVERRERATDAGIVFQRVETGIEGDGQAAVLEAVPELSAFAIERAETAERTLA